jgi:hypothetical protein
VQRGAIRGLHVCPPLLAAKVQDLCAATTTTTTPRPASQFALRGERLDARVAEAAVLLATMTGQDIEETDDGRFRIFEGTAPDRVISTVDPQARHGHKTAAHGFDGDKAHVAVDPDSEIICAAEVSPAAIGDAVVAPTLLGDVVPGEGEQAARAVSMATAPTAPAPTWPGWTSTGLRRW